MKYSISEDKMKNLIKKGIAIAGLAALASCASLYPYKQCKKGVNAWECSIAENWSEDWNSYHTRYTEADGNCMIDVDKGQNYTVMIDKNCDRTVDTYFDDNGLKTRSDFGNIHDVKFGELKNKVGSYSWQNEDFYEARGNKAFFKF